jgi:hypothetical protein
MPIVKCPSCGTRYDPGIDDTMDGLPSDLSMKVVCPTCGQWLRLPEREPVDPPDVSAEVLREMSKQSKVVEEGPSTSTTPRAGRPAREERDPPRSSRGRDDDYESPRSSRRGRDDDDYESPRSSRRGRDADEDRPSRRGRDDDYDDDYDSPPRRDDDDDYDRPRKPKSDGLGITSMILGIASCVVTFAGCCCLLFDGVSLLLGIAAVITGFMARSQNPKSGMALAGIITGFAGIGLTIVIFVLALAFNVGNAMNR